MTVSATPQPSALVLDQVERTYQSLVPVRALAPTTLRIEPGDLVGVVGRSGSGKSTLLNVLGLLDRPTAGTYRVGGIDTAGLNEIEQTALRSWQFGFLFQDPHLLADRSCCENVELALLYRGSSPGARRLRAVDALEMVGMGDRVDALPGELSGGERQRVAIARALAQSSPVLLCDEPTGNLDRKNSDNVVGLLTTLNATGLTVVIVTHDEAIAAQMRRCFVVSDGVISVRGSTGGLAS